MFCFFEFYTKFRHTWTKFFLSKEQELIALSKINFQVSANFLSLISQTKTMA